MTHQNKLGGNQQHQTHTTFFDIEKDETKIYWTNTDLFCHFVEQILYMSIILCPYIQLNVSLLYARVRDNDTNE